MQSEASKSLCSKMALKRWTSTEHMWNRKLVSLLLLLLLLLLLGLLSLPTPMCRSAWVRFSSPSVCLSVCPQYNSKTNDPKVFKLGVGNDLGIHLKWYCSAVQRSKVKVTGSITLHNNTSFRTTIAFHSHSLGGDTSTIMLQPRFVVIRYSLGGDTDNSNTAWVQTPWVHSSCHHHHHHLRQSSLNSCSRWLTGRTSD